MALVLIRTRDNGTGAAHWRRGDVVQVFFDDHVFGRLETKAAWVAAGGDPADWDAEREPVSGTGRPGGFFVVRVRGLPPEKLRDLVQEERDAEGNLVRRRNWKANLDALPADKTARLESRGEAVVDDAVDADLTRKQAGDLVRSKVDNSRFPLETL